MVENSRDELEKAGAATIIHEVPGLVSFPHKGELRVLAPREVAIDANTLGHGLPMLPCVGIARIAGLQLPGMLAAGPVRVSCGPTSRTAGTRCRSSPARSRRGRAAASSWWAATRNSWPEPQATDNPAGSACVLELARVLEAPHSELRRDLLCGFWAAHETGALVGSSWFAERN